MFTKGSLSVIMYSFGVSGDTECSRASAGLEKSRRHRGPWMSCSKGSMRRGRMFWGFDEDDVEAGMDL